MLIEYFLMVSFSFFLVLIILANTKFYKRNFVCNLNIQYTYLNYHTRQFTEIWKCNFIFVLILYWQEGLLFCSRSCTYVLPYVRVVKVCNGFLYKLFLEMLRLIILLQIEEGTIFSIPLAVSILYLKTSD